MRPASSVTSSVARLLFILPFGLLSACGLARPEQFGEAACPPFETRISPVLEARCQSCHGAALAEGGYRVDAYRRVVARRDDGSSALIPRERDSEFLKAVRGETAPHERIADAEVLALEDWAVRCRAETGTGRAHEKGWMTPTDSNFHGAVLRASAYAYGECRDCHGEDLRGGTSKLDCQTCHRSGVDSCSTCHGDATSAAPPKDLSFSRLTSSLGVGAHRAHVMEGELHAGFDCAVCHLTPAHPEDPGHYREEGGGMDGIAEVLIRGARGGTAVWDRQNATCANSACHAPNGVDALASNQTPVWTAGAGQATCGTCHGLPPADHPGTDCAMCHGAGYSETTVVKALHVNGRVDLREGTCNTCHGSEDNPAPPRDLAGRTDPSLSTIGAHQAHLKASRLAGPVACTECHVVPQNLNDPGHIDSTLPAEVFPQGAGAVARADGAVAMFDRTTGTCTTYCHGAGEGAKKDQSATLMRTPTWTGGTPQILCGNCHGIPPVDENHAAGTQLNQCHTCHGATIDDTGRLRIEPDGDGVLRSTHIDGKVQLGPR